MPTQTILNKTLLLALFPLTILTGCAGTSTTASAPVAQASASQAAQNKRNALAFYDAFFNKHDLSAAERYVAEGYIQHNPRVGNGRAAFVGAFTQIFARFPARHSTVHRAIAEGDLVALHVHTVTGPDDRGSAIVDIFRFNADGKIIEHWDVIQPVPETTASGNSMFN